MMRRVVPTELPSDEPFHAIHELNDPGTGLRGYIAVHNLARGPAFGGCRLWPYQSDREAMVDAQRLAEGMTCKNALAEIPFGGGKAVIIQSPRVLDRGELFRAFGRAVARLQGNYITAEDVGTTPADMKAVCCETRYVSGIPRPGAFGGDPARFTALGVFLSIQAAVRRILKRESLIGVKVAVQGLGSVGSLLCGELVQAGAEVWISEISSAKVDAFQKEWDAHLVPHGLFLEQPVHVLVPCAMGGLLTGDAIYRIKAPIIVGAANNQLGSPEDGDRLHENGIWYLPDFLVNAGGVIAAAREYLGSAVETEVLSEVGRIADRAERLIDEVRRNDEAPLRVALRWAQANVGRPGSIL